MAFAVPAACASALVRLKFEDDDEWLLDNIGIASDLGRSQAWSALNIVIGLLLTTRCGQALSRFWEGLTLVHQMSAEWFDASSSLVAFSHHCNEHVSASEVDEFQHTLVRLMSLMHGSALHQIKENKNEDFEVLGVSDLDDEFLVYLMHCKEFGINRVEVLLHWIHELVTSCVGPDNVLSIPAPILSRVYQELSRGMVNLNDARKITETPFPFPFAQIIVILLIGDTFLIPIMVAMFVENAAWAAVFTFIATLSMWSVNMIAGELEQPFGNDANDLPLAMLQENLNRSLLVLLDPRAQRVPKLKSEICVRAVEAENAGRLLRHNSMGSAESSRSTEIRPEVMNNVSVKNMTGRTVTLDDLSKDIHFGFRSFAAIRSSNIINSVTNVLRVVSGGSSRRSEPSYVTGRASADSRLSGIYEGGHVLSISSRDRGQSDFSSNGSVTGSSNIGLSSPSRSPDSSPSRRRGINRMSEDSVESEEYEVRERQHPDITPNQQSMPVPSEAENLKSCMRRKSELNDPFRSGSSSSNALQTVLRMPVVGAATPRQGSLALPSLQSSISLGIHPGDLRGPQSPKLSQSLESQ